MEEDQRLRLAPMHQLSEALCDDDDWTGMKDPAERRKRQVRLSLRAYRKRKAARMNPRLSTLVMIMDPDSQSRQQVDPVARSKVYQQMVVSLPHLFIPAAVDHKGTFIPMRSLYPISRDHLMPLIEYNVWRATLTNVLILGHIHLIGQQTCSFGHDATIFPNLYRSNSLPKSLEPTTLQRTHRHPDWIDILPSPKMRDNAMRTYHLIPRDELCADVMGRMSGGQYNTDSAIMVWSNPWEPDGWELSEAFIRKWWMLVKDCDDILDATNKWRALRGDDPLTF
ncbi:hypothetical protein LTR84_001793 [Exophiala bonariae]|uniref:HNH nuclease domain-containing protein n=1 Tax=Exophiala bonariae TaxID=1690606 RepID=A0AAV9NF59_9EURO|nr:hypothetical protein LTR84_001793 [Exophiala bonariae]